MNGGKNEQEKLEVPEKEAKLESASEPRYEYHYDTSSGGTTSPREDEKPDTSRTHNIFQSLTLP